MSLLSDVVSDVDSRFSGSGFSLVSTNPRKSLCTPRPVWFLLSVITALCYLEIEAVTVFRSGVDGREAEQAFLQETNQETDGVVFEAEREEGEKVGEGGRRIYSLIIYSTSNSFIKESKRNLLHKNHPKKATNPLSPPTKPYHNLETKHNLSCQKQPQIRKTSKETSKKLKWQIKYLQLQRVLPPNCPNTQYRGEQPLLFPISSCLLKF